MKPKKKLSKLYKKWDRKLLKLGVIIKRIYWEMRQKTNLVNRMKKKVYWQTTYGRVEVLERIFRVQERGFAHFQNQLMLNVAVILCHYNGLL